MTSASALLSFDTFHFEKLALSDEFWGASTLVCCLKMEPLRIVLFFWTCPAVAQKASQPIFSL
jgi:hypothetical protein